MPWKLSAPLDASVWKPLAENPLPFAGLLSSLTDEQDYVARVEGKLPDSLAGTLYRNGPGRFDRGGFRKRMALDGDGLVQALTLGAGEARYRCRYVRTPKFEAEEQAGRFLYPTWSTLAPEGLFVNWGGKIPSQAGITVLPWANRLFAFDENQPAFELEPDRLETLGEIALDPEQPHLLFTAHYKIDEARNELLHFSVRYGRKVSVKIVAIDAKGNVKQRYHFPLPRPAYLHDWLVSDRHFIFILHPAAVSLPGLLQVLVGRKTYADVVEWRPQQGNLVAVFPREANGGPARFFEMDSRWMWHGVNAFEREGEIVVDFVASEKGGGLGEEESPIFVVMQGRMPKLDREPFTELRRYRLPLNGEKATEAKYGDGFSFEMPTINAGHACHAYRYGYVAGARPGQLFWSAVARVDAETGRTECFDFGDGLYASEPIFAPHPDAASEAKGWCLSQVYDGKSKKSFVAVLDGERLADGPLAKIWLNHHVPMSFHGAWHRPR